MVRFFATACLVVATAEAWNPIKAWQAMPRTVKEAQQIHRANRSVSYEPMHPSQRLHLQQRAHHAALRTRATRAKLGLPILGDQDDTCTFFPDEPQCQNQNNDNSGGDDDDEDSKDESKDEILAGITNSYELLNGFLGEALGAAKGLQYSEYDFNVCFATVENTSMAVDLFANSLKNFYLPWYSSVLMQSFTDTIILQSTIYEDCSLAQGIETFSGIFSQEGASQLLMRLSSGMAYELPTPSSTKWQEAVTGYRKGEIFGEYLSVILQFNA